MVFRLLLMGVILSFNALQAMESGKSWPMECSTLFPLPERLLGLWEEELIWGDEESSEVNHRFMKSCRDLYIEALSVDDIQPKLNALSKLEELIAKNSSLSLFLQDKNKLALSLMHFAYGQLLFAEKQFEKARQVFFNLRQTLWGIHAESDIIEDLEGLSIFNNYYLCLLSSLRPFQLRLCEEINGKFPYLSSDYKKYGIAPYVLATMVTLFSTRHLTEAQIINTKAVDMESVVETVNQSQRGNLGLLPMHILHLTAILKLSREDAPDIVLASLNESLDVAQANVRRSRRDGVVEEFLCLSVMKSFLRE